MVEIFVELKQLTRVWYVLICVYPTKVQIGRGLVARLLCHNQERRKRSPNVFALIEEGFVSDDISFEKKLDIGQLRQIFNE
jgi:hypothetical protein